MSALALVHHVPNPITTFQAIVLGVLQGATELFPVSSLGHTERVRRRSEVRALAAREGMKATGGAASTRWSSRRPGSSASLSRAR